MFLGIDGGGSKTTCVIGDDTSLRGSGVAGPSNVVRVGEKQAKAAISTALRQACTAANVAPERIQRTCAGVAGGARPETAAIVRRIIAELVPGEIEVVGDMVIALEAAFGIGPGPARLPTAATLRAKRHVPAAGASPFPMKAPGTGSAAPPSPRLCVLTMKPRVRCCLTPL
jgi:hypothetical protein